MPVAVPLTAVLLANPADEVKQPMAGCADDVFQKRACGRLEEGLASAEGQTGIVADP